MPDGDGVHRIHHVGITVAELDRSLVFYRDLLGMSVIGLSDDKDVGAIVGIPGASARIADPDAGNGQIVELLEYSSPNRDGRAFGPDSIGRGHLSLKVSELRSALSPLASGGFLPVSESQKLAGAGAWQDYTVVYLRDPDGVFVELIEGGAGRS